MKKKNKKVTNKYSLKSLMLNNTALGTTKDELIKGQLYFCKFTKPSAL